MSEEKKLDSNKNILLAVGAIVLIFAGFFIYKSTQTETVSVSVGGKEISATFKN